jgi:hypothetical protein
MADNLFDTIEDIADELSPKELAELENLHERELQRQNRSKDFVQMMTRPETVKSEKISDNTEGSSMPSGEPTNTDGDGTTGDGDGTATDGDGKKAENTEGSPDKEKLNIPIKDFLNFEKIPEWYNQGLIFLSEFGHDIACDMKLLQDERKHIFSVVATQKDLDDAQRKFYQTRYDDLEKLINDRLEGRKTLAQRLDFSKDLKDKFGEAFQKWLESIDFNFKLTPLQALILMVFASLIYSGFVIYSTQQEYKK